MKIKFTLILFSLFIFIGCDKLLTKHNETSDDDLIAAIIESEQEDIAIEEMPILSRNTINQEYGDFIEIIANLAPNTGYQVSMDGKDHKPGDHNEIYFNLKGRELISKKGRHQRGGFRCFELVLPVTFIMPSGLSIIVESESGYKDVKDWYENNPVDKEKPQIQYPVNVIYKDGLTETIEDDEGMKDIKTSCRKWHDDKKNWNCFKFVYPITFLIEDGSTISMQDPKDWSGLKAWHEANPQSEKPHLRYPVDITFKDGTTQTITTDEEMRNAKTSCID